MDGRIEYRIVLPGRRAAYWALKAGLYPAVLGLVVGVPLGSEYPCAGAWVGCAGVLTGCAVWLLSHRYHLTREKRGLVWVDEECVGWASWTGRQHRVALATIERLSLDVTLYERGWGPEVGPSLRLVTHGATYRVCALDEVSDAESLVQRLTASTGLTVPVKRWMGTDYRAPSAPLARLDGPPDDRTQ